MTAPPLQWSIFAIDLDPVPDRRKIGVRPVLVVSRESANAALPVVTVVPLAEHRPGRRIYPNEVLVPSEVAGLTNDSIAMVHQTRTVPKRRLTSPVGVIDDPDLRSEVRRAMRIQLNLELETGSGL
jgi:mRNA interferase MazF